MTHIAVVGCGVVGAAIAYELSQVAGLRVTVLEQQAAAHAATGAALGVLMGAISQKGKGRNLRMRLSGIQRYNEWVPQLEAATGRPLLFNRQGILRLCFAGERWETWQSLATIRARQGWVLELRDRTQLVAEYPYLSLERVIGAVYSPQDRQIDPVGLTLALVEAARQREVQFQFQTAVTEVDWMDAPDGRQCRQLHTTAGHLTVDGLVIAAGLGSTPLTRHLQQPVDIRPVLGQALQLRLPTPLSPMPQPVITGEDTHIVPLGNGEYWVGATVEFAEPPGAEAIPTADAAALEQVRQRAIALCPALADATQVRAWSGLRPRPEGRPAPIVEPLPGYDNVWLATGHYRNGVLLAPATAVAMRQAITERSGKV